MSSIKLDGFAKVIFEQIEGLFVEEVGPVAPILCEEGIQKWIEHLKESQQRPSLRHINWYLEYLASEIGDDQAKADFIERVYSIDALAPYKKYYAG